MHTFEARPPGPISFTADVRISGNQEAQRQVRALRDSDAGSGDDLEGSLAVAPWTVSGPAVTSAPLRARVMPERPRQFARSRSEIFGLPRCRTVSLASASTPCTGCMRANQDAAGLPLGFRDQVQTLIHSVDKVDVCVAGRTENYARPVRDSRAECEARSLLAQIRFCFDDDPAVSP